MVSLQERLLPGPQINRVSQGRSRYCVDAPTSKEELRRIVSCIHAPVSANMIEGGKTTPNLEKLKAMGLTSVGYPLMESFSAARAVAPIAI